MSDDKTMVAVTLLIPVEAWHSLHEQIISIKGITYTVKLPARHDMVESTSLADLAKGRRTYLPGIRY